MDPECEPGYDPFDPFSAYRNSTQQSHEKYHDFRISSIFVAMVMNTIILLTQLCLFGCLMKWRRARNALAPLLPDETFKQMPKHVFGWAIQAWRSRKEVVPTDPKSTAMARDLDGIIMVRFCNLGLKYCMCGSFVACILIPVYASGDGNAEGFNRYNISNLAMTGYTLNRWVPVFAAYALVACFLHFVHGEWKDYVVLREAHFKAMAMGRGGAGAAQAWRSVIVEGVPIQRIDKQGLGVRRYFERLFPARGGLPRVHTVVLQKDTRAEHGKIGAKMRREARWADAVLTAELESLGSPVAESLAHHSHFGLATRVLSTEDDSNRHFVRTESMGSMDSNQHGSRSLKREHLKEDAEKVALVLEDITVGHDGVMLGNELMSSTAWVTFYMVSDRVIAEQLVLEHGSGWSTRAAPERRDIIWENAAVPLDQVQVRATIAHVIQVIMLVFWSVPVSAIQVWCGLEWLPHDLDWAENHRVEFELLSSYLPVLAMMLLMYFLPFALDWLQRRYVGFKVNSEVQRLVTRRYLHFLLATLYVTVMSSSLSSTLGQAWRSPKCALQVLKTKVPQVGCYFITYVMARIGISVPMLLLFPVLNLRLNEGQQAHTLTRPDIPMESSSLGLVLVLALTYSVIAPCIMPVCAMYFALASLVYRWLFLYVYETEFDSCGVFWNELFHGAMHGLLVGTLSLAALADYNSMQFVALLILAMLVILSHSMINRRKVAPSRFLSLIEARKVDMRTPHKVIEDFDPEYYRDPLTDKVLSDDSDEENSEESSEEEQ